MKYLLGKSILNRFFCARGVALFCSSAIAATVVFREPVPEPKVEKLAPLAVQTHRPVALSDLNLFIAEQVFPDSKPLPVKHVHKRYPRKHFPVAVTRNWHSQRVLARRTVMHRDHVLRNQFIDSELAADFANEATVVNTWDPELSKLDDALDTATNDRTQIDPETDYGLPIEPEQPFLEKAGVYQRNTFSEIKQSFAQLTDPEFTKSVATALPILVIPTVKQTTANSVSPVLAGVGSELPQVSKPRVTTPSKVATHSRIATPRRSAPEPAPNAPFETDLFVRTLVSDDLDEWLTKEKAHFEIYLQPIGNRDPQETRYLSQSYPQDSFRESKEALKGRYELVAGFYRPQDVDVPYAEIRHPKEINAVTANQNVKFFLDVKDFAGVRTAGSNRRYVGLSLSFFEGAEGDYRIPKDIPNAEVEVVGFPELGALKADAAGNLRIDQVPSHSQLVLQVKAPGYYQTFRTVPVFGADVHLPIYLISKQKVDAIARTMAGVHQVEKLSVLMGRVFDPQTRNPLEAERLDLVGHPKRNGQYFGLYVDEAQPKTTATGLYSYFNVSPAFRYLSRPDSDKRVLRMNLRPETGYYVELGRGGMKPFRGKLSDPNMGAVAGAHVRLVGDEDFEVVSDKDGKFEIPNIDFPSGVIAIDVEADGYPLTRHTVAWNPRQGVSTQDLFMVENRFVEESIASSQTASIGPNPSRFVQDDKKGNLIGGAYGALFKQTKGCLRAELWSVDSQKVVDSAYGPFPFRGSLRKGDTLCLRPDQPGLNYLGLASGEYLLKWKNDEGQTLGARIVHIGMGRDTIAVN